MKRVGIFVFFDKDGIVDDYVLYLLDEMKKYLDTIITVSNGFLSAEYGEKLIKRSDFFFERNNMGYDFGAWKSVLVNKFPNYWWEEFDEIVFFNDTFYGPICSLDNMFITMDKENTDFWGMTRFGSTMEGEELVKPFVQTYFWAVRKRLFSNEVFWEFWEQVDETTKDFDQVLTYEKEMSAYFQKNNFILKTYIDTTDLEFSDEEVFRKERFNFSVDKMALEDLLYRGFPFIKRKNFFFPLERLTEYKLGDDLRKSINYVKENSDYDVKMIFQNILRIRELGEIQRNLNIRYIIEANDGYKELSAEQSKKILMIIYVDKYTSESFLEHMKRLKNVSLFIIFDSFRTKVSKLRFFMGKQEKVCICNSNVFLTILNNVDILEKYSYINYSMEIKNRGRHKLVSNSINEYMINTLYKNEEYIEKIVKLFEEDKMLGLLYPQKIIGLWDRTKQYVESNYIIETNLVFWIRGGLLYNFLKQYENKLFTLMKHYSTEISIKYVLNEIEFYLKNMCCYKGEVISVEYASLFINNFVGK